jgi:hypothetical protein
MTLLFDGLELPVRGLSAGWALVALSVPAGLLFLWLFGKVSNQDAIAEVKDRIRGHLLGVRLFRHDLGVSLALQGRILRDTAVYLRHSLLPMLILLVPVLLILTQVNLRYSVRPLEPGEVAMVRAVVRDASTLTGPIVLDAPAGVVVETPAVRIRSMREAVWRVRADAPGRHEIAVRAGGASESKEILVGAEPGRRVSARRPGGGFFDVLLWPGEPPIPRASAVEAVEVAYPERELRLLGLRFHWLVLFFVVSLAAGYGLKGLFGVQV